MRMTIALALCALTACAHHTGGDDVGDTAGTLTIDPPSSELLVLNGVAATESFTATLTAPDGTVRDVTANTVFALDSSAGAFTDNTLSIATAGKVTVVAVLSDKQANAQVIVRLKSIRVDPSLPANTPDLFAGPDDPTRAPTIVYPPADVAMPRNVGDFETHWIDAFGNDVFEISLHTDFSDVRVYVPGGNGDPAAGPEPSWTAFLASEWLAAVGTQQTVAYQVRGIASANPTTIGAGPAQVVKLSNEDMLGGLYYWATASTTGVYGIYRHDMSKPGEPAEEFLTTNQTAGRCVACHVLSRDGTKMGITYDGGGGAATMVDVGTTSVAATSTNWNFGTFTPDGNQFLAVEQGGLVVRNYADMAPMATMPTASTVSHPDLSVDGAKLVYVHPGTTGSDWQFQTGSIYARSYDATTMQFGAEVPVVADGANNYYPSWSPDGQWILFNKTPATGYAYNDANASLWVVKADGSSPPVELAAANHSPGLTNSWGRWAPFPQTYGAGGEPMYWITVSSKRDFGVRLVGVNRPQIWMTPFFPNRAATGADPSMPAFRLPFQNLESSNHIAQWAERVVVTQ